MLSIVRPTPTEIRATAGSTDPNIGAGSNMRTRASNRSLAAIAVRETSSIFVGEMDVRSSTPVTGLETAMAHAPETGSMRAAIASEMRRRQIAPVRHRKRNQDSEARNGRATGIAPPTAQTPAVVAPRPEIPHGFAQILVPVVGVRSGAAAAMPSAPEVAVEGVSAAAAVAVFAAAAAADAAVVVAAAAARTSA